MNIFIKEIRFNSKAFLIGLAVLCFFTFAGMVKFTGVESGGTAMASLINAFPRIVLAVLGFSATLDIGTIGGFYALLEVYSMIIMAVYAVHLGRNAVSRERVDNTYEFLFTKPRSRFFILAMKYGASMLYLFLFSLFNFVFSQLAYSVLNLSENMLYTFVFFSFELFLVGVIFFAFSAFCSAAFARSERGSLVGNLGILVAYLLGVAYDMMEGGREVVRFFSPFKYFDPNDLLNHVVDPLFLGLSGGLIVVFLMLSLVFFQKRDLT